MRKYIGSDERLNQARMSHDHAWNELLRAEENARAAVLAYAKAEARHKRLIAKRAKETGS